LPALSGILSKQKKVVKRVLGVPMQKNAMGNVTAVAATQDLKTTIINNIFKQAVFESLAFL